MGLFLLPSILGDSRRETQIIKTYASHAMLTPPHTHTHQPHTHGTSCGASDLNSFLLVETQTDLIFWSYQIWKNQPLPSTVFFKILKFSGSSQQGMTSTTHSIHSGNISCLGVYYNRWWLSYPFCAGMQVHCLTMTPKPETLRSSKPYQTK